MDKDVHITKILHPVTYVNKVLISFDDGKLELWNIIKKSLIYTFQSNIKYFSGLSVPSISCLEQSPACDVVGVGYNSGDILLLNIKYDIILFSFRQDSGVVTSLSFRTDFYTKDYPYMVSGTHDGRIFVWNLGKKEENENFSKIHRLESCISEAHFDKVSQLHFLHGEPILLSSSIDNSLKAWIFDNSDGSPRLLRCRAGHFGSSTRIKFYGGHIDSSSKDSDGHSFELLSVGSDCTFRCFNTVSESQNCELSQKSILSKLKMHSRNARLPIILDFDFCEKRQNDWNNIVTIHKNHANAYLWKLQDRTISNIILKQDHPLLWSSDYLNHSTALAVSSCGNFVVIGTRRGVIYKYNIQSGLPRGSFPVEVNCSSKMNLRSNTPGNVLHELTKILNLHEDDKINPSEKDHFKSDLNSDAQFHTKDVTGIFIDVTNAHMVSSSLDMQLLFWDFESQKCMHCIKLKCEVLILKGYRDGNFIATVGLDNIIRIYDVNSRKLSRRLIGHKREITDICFTPDGRRLLSSSSDGSLRTWDLPTGRCLSWLLYDSAVMSIAVSSSGEFICVSQFGNGIGMSIDRSFYETVHFWKEPEEPIQFNNSLIQGGLNNSEIMLSEYDSSYNIEYDGIESSKSQVGNGLITFSSIPKAFWITLFKFETLKQINRIENSNSKSDNSIAVPFFLPTIKREGTEPSFPTPHEYSSISNLNEPSCVTDSNLNTNLKRSGSEFLNDYSEIHNENFESENPIFKNMSSVWTDHETNDTANALEVRSVHEFEQPSKIIKRKRNATELRYAITGNISKLYTYFKL